MNTFQLIYYDYIRNFPSMKKKSKIFYPHMICALFSSASFMTTFWFRIGSSSTILQKILYLPYRYINFITGICLPLGTKVGKGIKFQHYSGIIISKHVTIGDNCTIYQGTTIGKTVNGYPQLSNNVTVCANATVIGNIKIGAYAIIGAGAVVTKDVPDNAIVIGNPA